MGVHAHRDFSISSNGGNCGNHQPLCFLVVPMPGFSTLGFEIQCSIIIWAIQVPPAITYGTLLGWLLGQSCMTESAVRYCLLVTFPLARNRPTLAVKMIELLRGIKGGRRFSVPQSLRDVLARGFGFSKKRK
jgi:hypothetical protein